MTRILVVEDSMLSRRMVVDALKEAGYETSEAKNGEMGLEMFRENRPDCVVSDLLMPIMDGQTLLGHIRELDTEVPVIIASADIQQSSRDICESLGINGFLNKPVKSADLLERIKAALTHSTEVELHEAK
ncbi:MAG: response regulator [Planctomycetes bacterium]|nr:response regulator [Planctomycetota bacterium]